MPYDCYGQRLMGDNLTAGDVASGREYPNFVDCKTCGNTVLKKDIEPCIQCGEDSCNFCRHRCKGCGEWVHTDCHGLNLMCKQCEADTKLMAFIVKKLKGWWACEEGLEYAELHNDPERWWNECKRYDWLLWVADYLGIYQIGDITFFGIHEEGLVGKVRLHFPAARVLAEFKKLQEADNG